jgi:hypothetical protein
VALPSQHRDYRAAFLDAQKQAHALVAPLGHAAFNWKPDAGTWSVAECLEHINIVAAGYLPDMEAAVRDPDAPRGTPPFRHGLLGRLFVWLMRPDGFKMPTIPSMAPPKTDGVASDLDQEAVRAAFDAQTSRFTTLVEEAADRDLDLRRTRVTSPFASFLRLSLGAMLDALGQHALRHVAQARRVTERAAFPAEVA